MPSILFMHFFFIKFCTLNLRKLVIYVFIWVIIINAIRMLVDIVCIHNSELYSLTHCVYSILGE